MNNLYKVLFSHTAPKDTEVGIVSYVVAKDDVQVYALIDEKYNYGKWKDAEEEGEEFKVFDGNYNVIGTETFREKIMRIHGDMHDEDYDFSDAYYGITLYGWELVRGVSDSELSVLRDLGIVIN